MSSNIRYFIFFAVSCLLIAMAFSAPAEYQDLQSAASGDDHYGRVQIKVYRGPTEHDGHDHFAPWGYWVKQPADDEHH